MNDPRYRSRDQRFHVMEGDGNRIFVDDDDFGWDAALRITGDFDVYVDKLRFAKACADALNVAAEAGLIPTRKSQRGE